MDVGTLLIFGLIAAVLAIGGFFLMIFMAILIYDVKNLYPPVRRIALWASRLRNFLPLLILGVVLLVLIILIGVTAFRLPALAALFLLLILLILLAVLIVVAVALLLGIAVYIVRLVVWLYGRWNGLLGGLVPQVMKLKIKHDVDKGKDKDWTTHLDDMRQRLSGQAEDARRRVSGGGKKT